MNNGWQTEKLGDVCRFIDYRGKTPEKTRSGLRLITAKNVKMGYLQETPAEFVSPRSYATWMTRGIPKMGDVVFTTEAPLANVAQLDTAEKVVFAQRIIVLQPTIDNLDRTFLKYLLMSDVSQQRIHGDGTGATVKGIKASLLKELPIRFPPLLSEQRRIIGILNETFAAIASAKANAERNLQNARALFISRVQSVLSRADNGWAQRRLGDIARVKGGKRVPKGYKLLTEPTGYPYLRVTEFTDDGTIDMTDLRYVSPEVHRQIKNYVITPADLYVSIAGTIGKTGIVPRELDGANLTENACRLVFNSGISNRFVYYFTTTPNFIEQAGLNTRTAAQPKLALSRLTTIKLAVPSFAEQQRVVAQFDDLRVETKHLESLYHQKVGVLDALKQSLLHQAFTGNL